MGGLFSGIQFVGPWFLAGLLLTPLLIYAYRNKTPQKRKTVSSLILLRTLQKREAPKTKFKPPLRFFLELLALASLMIAAAMPVQTDSARRAALLIDNTLSMRALETTGRTPGTRLERAKELARKWLGEQRGSTAVDVYTTSPKLTRIGPESQSPGSAEESLDDIKATSASDNLEAEIAELGESGSYDRIVTVTDKTIEYSESAEGGGTLFSESDPNKKYTRTIGISTGERARNVFVGNLSLVQGTVSEPSARLTASLGAAGPGPQTVKAVFSEIGEGEETVGTATATLAPGRTEEASVNLEAGVKPNVFYRVRITPADERAGGKSDAIVEDNTAWLAPQSAAGEKILLISPDQTAGTSGLEKLSAFAVEGISPAEFPERAAAGLEKYSLLVFHRSTPSVPPQRSTLLILPPPDNPLFPAVEDVRDASVSSWMSEHPITSYLKVPLLTLPAAEILSVPPWAQSVIRAEQGAVVAAGESHGVRFAAVGMELLPFEGARTPVPSVLTLNLLNWLGGGTQLTGSTLTGTTMRLDAKEKWRIKTPAGREETRTGDEASVIFTDPGPYRLKGAGEEKLLAANAFFPDESDTYSASSFTAKRAFAHERKIEEGAEPWWPYLLAAALGLLFVEQLLLALPERRKA